MEVVHLAQRRIWSDLVVLIGRWDDDRVLVGLVRHCIADVLVVLIMRQR